MGDLGSGEMRVLESGMQLCSQLADIGDLGKERVSWLPWDHHGLFQPGGAIFAGPRTAVVAHTPLRASTAQGPAVTWPGLG